MTSRNENVTEPSGEDAFSRRKFLTVASAGVAGTKAPLGKLVGTITPTDLHYERSHSGNPDLDPAKHRLLV
jgi:hypothetical protein